jgi:X-Pro dipeptidyl-peptidase
VLAFAVAHGCDTTPPVLQLADRRVETTSAAGTPVGFAATATDALDGDVAVTCDPASGSAFPVGATTVHCSATDASGNTATGSFTVLVVDVARATGDVGGTVPAMLSLTLGGAASFGAFTPGLEHDYTASTTATVTSTAGDAMLTVSDPGHLANGAFTLPSPLQVQLAKTTWTGPVSNDPVAIAFSQHIGANDALRTGGYSRTVTFTLSTTTP